MLANGTGGGNSSKARWASGKDFDEHREVITELYNRTTLPSLMQTMETEHGFIAT